jgi:hypothetical protein
LRAVAFVDKQQGFAKLRLQIRHNGWVMKRCPQCDFIYDDSDTVCDLDGKPLVSVREEVVESSAEGWKWLTLIAVIGTVLGIAIFVTYHRFTQKDLSAQVNNQPAVMMAAPASSPLLVETATPAPEVSPAPAVKASPTPRGPTTSTKLSANPVSTTSDQSSARGVTIRLADGGTIAADEAWSTKEGIWYRRNGVVTLLKRNRVKSIERSH